jgi:DNA-binding CsgD family transcriptional regulator
VADGFITAEGAAGLCEVPAKPENINLPQGCGAAPEPVPERIARIGPDKPAAVPISAAQREQLLDRLAQGASNIELAQEFSLTPRQIQGMRMGSARKMAQRRHQLRPPEKQLRSEHTAPMPAVRVPELPEDVVRYLRQQDDVVVPQGDGYFLVNGRFRLGLAELVDRANRMRARQGRPEFKLANGHASPIALSLSRPAPDVPGRPRSRDRSPEPRFRNLTIRS